MSKSIHLIEGKKGISKAIKVIGILIIMILIAIMFFAVYQNIIDMAVGVSAMTPLFQC